MRSKLLPLVLTLLAAAACGDSIEVPAPEESTTARPLPEPEPSVVHVPVTLSLGALAGKVETAVPRGDNNEAEWHPLGEFPVVGTLYLKEMWERDPLQVSLSGDRVEVSTRVRYRARVAERACAPVVGCRWVPLASCGHDGPMPSLRVGLRTTVTWKPDWTVVPRTTARPVEAGVRCKLTRARVDVTEKVQEQVLKLLSGAAPKVDEEIREAVALRRRVDRVWAEIQEPISAGSGVYLVFQPESVAVAQPKANGMQIGTVVSLRVRPKVVIGERPTPQLRPLPDFAPAASGDSFRIALVAELPFEHANVLLGQALVGKEFTVRDHKVSVRGARLYPGGERVVLEVKLGGDARGTVYFVGTPRYDPVAREVSVPDLDFSVETQNVLGRAADWLLHEDLRGKVRGAARFAVGERIDQIHRDVNEAINRDLSKAVRLRARVDSIRPLGVVVTPRSVATVVEAGGRAQIDITIR